MVSAQTYRVNKCGNTYALAHLASLLCLLLVAACSQSIAGDGESNLGPDAGEPEPISTNDPDAGEALPEPEEITLRSTGTDTIAPLNSISCNSGDPDFIHTDNRYYRVYDLGVAGVNSDLNVSSVDVGIEKAIGAGGTQSMVVSLHSLTGPIETGTMVQLAVASVPVPDQTETLLNVPISVTVPAGTTLVVEVFTPDGAALGNSLFLGSNREAESTPTYILAPPCGIEQPTPVAALAIPDVVMSLVLNVNGQHTPQ